MVQTLKTYSLPLSLLSLVNKTESEQMRKHTHTPVLFYVACNRDWRLPVCPVCGILSRVNPASKDTIKHPGAPPLQN